MKVAQRKKSSSSAVTPYEGTKYQEDQYGPILFEAECGIREADAMSDAGLTDREVRKSLEGLVLHLRKESPLDYTADCVASRIQERWKDALPRQNPRFSHSDLSGVLRTIMKSLDVRTRMTPGGRGYLSFLIGFLGKAGFQVRRAAPDELVVPIEELPSPTSP
jgi:hypothetical protein